MRKKSEPLTLIEISIALININLIKENANALNEIRKKIKTFSKEF